MILIHYLKTFVLLLSSFYVFLCITIDFNGAAPSLPCTSGIYFILFLLLLRLYCEMRIKPPVCSLEISSIIAIY